MLASNPNPIKRVCQFKHKLDTTDGGEYVVLQAGSWQKGGTTIATVTGGSPFDLYKPGHLVRDGRVARKCNRWPFTPYCNQFSPFVRDASDYNPILSRKGWDEATCEDVEHTNQASEDLSGKNDEFVSNLGPLFASNGHLLVKKDGTCVNLAINPEDYFKSSPAVKGCQKCATDNGFGSSADPTLCTPCQGGTTSKIVDGKSQCVLRNGATSSDEPSASPSTSGVPSNQPSDLPSDQPSDLPSNVPSDQPSDLPSLSPSTVLTSSYEYVGAVESANACAVKCNECVAGNLSGGAFRGFEFGDQECWCHTDSIASYTGAGGGSCTVVRIESGCDSGPIGSVYLLKSPQLRWKQISSKNVALVAERLSIFKDS
eukprot:scaffold17444_cov85-Skeletonema_dohrnii-CCMP3373.AAC.1